MSALESTLEARADQSIEQYLDCRCASYLRRLMAFEVGRHIGAAFTLVHLVCRTRAQRPRAIDEPFVKCDARIELGGIPCKIDRRLDEFG
jgi:hypothetical protein